MIHAHTLYPRPRLSGTRIGHGRVVRLLSHATMWHGASPHARRDAGSHVRLCASKHSILPTLVTQAAPGKEQGKERQHTEADNEVGEALRNGGYGEHVIRRQDTDVQGPVRQDREQDAPPGAVEQPREDHGDRDGEKYEPCYIERASVRCVPGRYQEQRKMPQSPQNPEHEASKKRSVQTL